MSVPNGADYKRLFYVHTLGGCVGHVPVSVTADGNCLFNALSLALTGSEERAIEIRLRTAICMILNEAELRSLADAQLALVSPKQQSMLRLTAHKAR